MTKKFLVEVEGYNDGHPYVVSKHTNQEDASLALKDFVTNNPKVRYRLIEVIVDFA